MNRNELYVAIGELLRDFHVRGSADDVARFRTEVMIAADKYAARCAVNAVSVALTGKSV